MIQPKEEAMEKKASANSLGKRTSLSVKSLVLLADDSSLMRGTV